MPLRRTVLGWVAATALAAGCGGTGGLSDASCPDDFPATCPSPEPHFAADVDPIFTASCRTCHVAGGMADNLPYDNYTEIRAQITTMIMQLRMCLMPPAVGPPITRDQRKAILGWISCGAMND
jgi:hypothetical protein